MNFKVGIDFDNGGTFTIIAEGVTQKQVDDVFEALRPFAPWLPSSEVVEEVQRRWGSDGD